MGLFKSRGQGYSSSLILSRRGKGLLQHPLPEQPQPCLEEMLKEEMSIPLLSACCLCQMLHFRTVAALLPLPTASPARSEGEL